MSNQWRTLVGLLLVLTFFAFASPAFGVPIATYDATGRWAYSTSGNWTSDPQSCPADPNTTDSMIITQSGISGTAINNVDGTVFSVSVNGTGYYLFASFLDGDAGVTIILNMTMSSAIYGSGTYTWAYTEPGFSCNGGATITSVTKLGGIGGVVGTPPTYDANGTWDYTTAGNWVDNAGDPECTADPNVTSTADITQSGSSITVFDNYSEDTSTGGVYGANYLFSDTGSEEGGTFVYVNNIALTSSTSGSGTTHWSWSNGYYYCNGGANIVISRAAAGPKDDLVMDFGPYGTFIYYNDSTWTKLHNLSPTVMATGDMDGNGMADVVMDFPGYGTFVYNNDTTWTKLHNMSPNHIATGNLDGIVGDEVIMDFPGYGTFVYDGTWTKLHNLSPELMATGDLDGNGRDEAIMGFSGYGTFVYDDDSGWAKMHSLSPTVMATGNLDGSGGDEVIMGFAGYGTFVYDGTWTKLHNMSPNHIATGNLDGIVGDEVIMDFPGYGTFVYDGTWSKLHSLSPDDDAGMATGNVDGDMER